MIVTRSLLSREKKDFCLVNSHEREYTCCITSCVINPCTALERISNMELKCFSMRPHCLPTAHRLLCAYRGTEVCQRRTATVGGRRDVLHPDHHVPSPVSHRHSNYGRATTPTEACMCTPSHAYDWLHDCFIEMTIDTMRRTEICTSNYAACISFPLDGSW